MNGQVQTRAGDGTAGRPRRLTFGALLHGSGGHIAAWRHPLSPPDGQLDLPFHIRLARTMERGTFDALFIADVVAIWGHDLDSLRRTARADRFEPLTLLAALSTVTERIGLVATATTTYNEPFHIARKFASLDHLSGGRAGWNVVTSVVPLEAGNFGRDTHLDHALRYRRAEEFVDVVRGLWDSFDDDAFLRDQKTGIYFDEARLHRLDHRGKHFAVTGPLNIPRPPQGRPVIVQAGSSDAGRALAASVADVVFTHHPDLAGAQAYYADLKARTQAAGRNPDEVVVLPGLSTVVGRTISEAEDKLERLTALLDPRVALADLAYWLGGVDLTAHPLDGPLPDLPPSNQSRSAQRHIVERARAGGLTIRQLAHQLARDTRTIVGTPESIADHIQEWFEGRGADGFNVVFPYLPDTLDDFATLVIPELRRRGLFRTEYTGRTLRENLGLSLPPSRWSAVQARSLR